MKNRTAYMISAVLLLIMAGACKPEIYTGPLDTPEGNWEGVSTEYYFNGEKVASLEGCEYSAISFYKQGLCCIEGVKGAFPYTYDSTSGSLQIDSTLWNVMTLTGAEMIMKYVGRIYPETASDQESEETGDPDENGVILPYEYNGMQIESGDHGYCYVNGSGESVWCDFYGYKDAEGNLTIDFWYDSHTDRFIPLVVEVKK